MPAFKPQAEKVLAALEALKTIAKNKTAAEELVHATARLAAEFEILNQTKPKLGDKDEANLLLSINASLESTFSNLSQSRAETKEAILHNLKSMQAQKSYKK